MPEFREEILQADAKGPLGDTHKHVLLREYPHRHFGDFCYRFNHHFDLRGRVETTLEHVMLTNERPESILQAAEVHA